MSGVLHKSLAAWQISSVTISIWWHCALRQNESDAMCPGHMAGKWQSCFKIQFSPHSSVLSYWTTHIDSQKKSSKYVQVISVFWCVLYVFKRGSKGIIFQTVKINQKSLLRISLDGSVPSLGKPILITAVIPKSSWPAYFWKLQYIILYQ